MLSIIICKDNSIKVQAEAKSIEEFEKLSHIIECSAKNIKEAYEEYSKSTVTVYLVSVKRKRLEAIAHIKEALEINLADAKRIIDACIDERQEVPLFHGNSAEAAHFMMGKIDKNILETKIEVDD